MYVRTCNHTIITLYYMINNCNRMYKSNPVTSVLLTPFYSDLYIYRDTFLLTYIHRYVYILLKHACAPQGIFLLTAPFMKG